MKIKTKSIKESMGLILKKQKRVSHCYCSDDNIIRIISARKATKNEVKTYNRYAGGEMYER